MKKIFITIVLLLLISVNGYSEDYAIQMNASNTSKAYQVRFDDKLLGEHIHDGTLAQDQRIRNFTYSVWLRSDKTEGDVLGNVQSTYYTSTGSFSVRLKDGKLGIYSRYMDVSGGFPGSVEAYSEEGLENNKWAFITLVADSDNKLLTLYKNGIQLLQVDLKGVGIGLLRDESIFFVGCNMFTADVDEIQLWNKSLSSDEVKQSMNLSETKEGLLYYYRFNNFSEENNSFENEGVGGECPAHYCLLDIKEAWSGAGADGIYSITSTQIVKPTLVEAFEKTTAIEELESIKEISYDFSSQTLVLNSKIKSVAIFDLSGQKILESMDKNIDLSALPNSIYLVKVKSTEGLFSIKLLK